MDLHKKVMHISSFIAITEHRVWEFFLRENGLHRTGLGLLGEVNWMVQHFSIVEVLVSNIQSLSFLWLRLFMVYGMRETAEFSKSRSPV